MDPTSAGAHASLRGYRIVRPLGTGGMGTVFVAEKLTTHQLYAIKFLKEDYARDPTYLARFEREIGALLAIRHPHVVNVFEWWFPPPGAPGTPYVVMELLDGEGLDQRLSGHRLLRPLLAVKIMLQVLDGLGAAHRVGVLHRDLGPSNVFLCTTNTPVPLAKILDFGLARPTVPGDESDSNLTSAGTLMGKPAYVAPEMLVDQPLDQRSDIFACGMMLFRMLAGRLPFRNTQQQALWVERYAEARAGTEIAGLRNFASWVPDSLEQVVARALRLRPEDRYQSVEQMQTDLLAVEEQLEVEDGLAAAGEPQPSEPSRRPSSPTPSTGSIRPSTVAGSRVTRSAVAPRRSLVLPLSIVAGAVLIAGAAVLLVTGLSSKATPSQAGSDGAPLPAVATPTDIAPPPDTATPSLLAQPAEPPPPLVAPPAVPGAPVETVLIRILGVPTGGTAMVGDVPLVSPPFEVAVPRSDVPLLVVVRADGDREFRTEVVPRENRTVEVKFERAGAGGGGRRPVGSGGGGRPVVRRDAGGSRPAFVEDPFR